MDHPENIVLSKDVRHKRPLYDSSYMKCPEKAELEREKVD